LASLKKHIVNAVLLVKTTYGVAVFASLIILLQPD